VYSIGYMHGDPRYSRFFAYLSMFTFSICGIVLSDNLITLFAFWELVGVSSYFLIGFWFEKDSASDAAKKAFIVNRVGDAGFLIGIGLVLTALGGHFTNPFNLNNIFAGISAGHMSGGMLTAAGICLFLGAVGKSAQFPLHIWLPDAMEGPTPVSALIHAATMVAAGVFLTARIFPMLTPDAMLFIAYIGGVTALMAAIIAVVRNDIKRVLAYSTMSQLGYMIMALGVGAYAAGFMHLITHAVFKALLFLGSGSVIHAVHTQDMREMGGLRKKMPVTFLTFLIPLVRRPEPAALPAATVWLRGGHADRVLHVPAPVHDLLWRAAGPGTVRACTRKPQGYDDPSEPARGFLLLRVLHLPLVQPVRRRGLVQPSDPEAGIRVRGGCRA
jgi:NADH-quinone oxidoreductase subunit L